MYYSEQKMLIPLFGKLRISRDWKNVPMIDIYYIEGKERYHPQRHLAPKWVALDGSRGRPLAVCLLEN